MAINLDFKNKENKQKLMMWTLIVVLVITFFVLYSYFFQSRNIVPLSSIEMTPTPPLEVQQRSLNADVLSSPIFQGLKKFGDYPVDVKDTDLGRENPFTPF